MGRSRRGFTLIEAMIVVVVVGALAVLAIASYRRWVQTAYLTEAEDMVKSIRAAQQAFRAENSGYLNVSQGLGPGFDYPALRPGQSKTAWGGACTGCYNQTAGWTALNVSSSAPMTFGYSTVANNGDNNKNAASLPQLTVNGQTLDLSTMTAPWYVVEADGDTNGDGVYCNVYGLSTTNQLYINNEGE
jgi:prepilin-type N-terminal cleavage/methylation domain-containing protein